MNQRLQFENRHQNCVLKEKEAELVELRQELLDVKVRGEMSVRGEKVRGEEVKVRGELSEVKVKGKEVKVRGEVSSYEVRTHHYQR